jgi:hypothetical protein
MNMAGGVDTEMFLEALFTSAKDWKETLHI